MRSVLLPLLVALTFWRACLRRGVAYHRHGRAGVRHHARPTLRHRARLVVRWALSLRIHITIAPKASTA